MISVLKRKEILTRGTAWMKLENTVLSEISQYYKLNACVPTRFIHGSPNPQVMVFGGGDPRKN